MSFQVHAQIEWADYPGKLPKNFQSNVKFGYLTVPENHEQPDGRKIQVAFSILKSNKKNAEAVLYLPGGPGGGYTSFMAEFTASPPIQKIIEQHDIVFLDPRGCGNSSPSLCENLNGAELRYPTIFGKTEEEIETMITAAAIVCKDSLDAVGIDPTTYNSTSVAHDVEMLRKALGYDQWILRGHSYGSYMTT